MKLTTTTLGLGLFTLTHASRLYVSSYSGNITTIELTDKPDGNSVDLKATFQSHGCAPSPSWLEYHSKASTLYCADEGFTTPDKAIFTSLKVETDGSLKLLDTVTTLNGGVSTTTYAVGKEKLMAVAHYGGSGISIVNTTDPSSLEVLRTYSFSFGFQPAGSNAANPAVPFIHQVVVDPTGNFLLAPDLSADMIHVFSFAEDGTLINPQGQDPLRVDQGSGPRHLVFYQPDGKTGKTYLYVVMEKMNMLHAYEVLYTATGTLEFKVVFMSTIFGGDELPTGAAAAEIKLTPDNKFLIISSRMDKLNPPGPLNPTSPSDTLVTFSLDPKTGIPKLLQKFSAGGIGPRSFAINRAGDRVAVALNAQNKLVILKRDVKTESFSGQLGSFDLDAGRAAGLVSSVVWAEEGEEDIVVGGGGGGGGSTSAVSVPTPSSSAKGPSLPSISNSSSSSEEGTSTTATTVLATATVTQSGYQATGSGSPDPAPSPPTLTRTVGVTPKAATSAPNTSTVPISPSSAGSTAGETTTQISQLTSSHLEVASPTPTATATRFPTTPVNPASSILPTAEPRPAAKSPSINSKPAYFAAMDPGSGSSPNPNPNPAPAPSRTSDGSGVSKSTVSLTGMPTPVQTDMVKKCSHFYEVEKGDTCDAICKKLEVPSKSFREWNPSVGTECKGLISGEWVCVGL